MGVLVQLARKSVSKGRAVIRTTRGVRVIRHSQRRVLLPITRSPRVRTNHFRVISRRTNTQRRTNRQISRVIRVMLRRINPFISVAFARRNSTIVVQRTTIRFVISIMRTKGVIIGRLFGGLITVTKHRRNRQVPMSRRITRVRGRVNSQLTHVRHDFTIDRRRIMLRVELSEPALRVVLRSLLYNLVPGYRPI